MDRLKILILAGIATALMCTQTAMAQTAGSLLVIAGNGQVVCPGCVTKAQKNFLPLVVQVLDLNGQPLPNKTVNWVALSTQGSTPNFQSQTFTDGNGLTTNSFFQNQGLGAGGNQFYQTVLQASADNASVNFTETQALADSTNSGLELVVANVNSPSQGTVLNGTAGAPLASPTVQVHVNSRGGAVLSGVSVRLVNSNTDPTTGATASCATGAGADVGSVLTDSNGDANCTVVFGPVTGTGFFDILVGGQDPTESIYTGAVITTPVGYLDFGPWAQIVVTPGVAGQVQLISGNGQSINPGQSSQPLVLKVSDSAGVNPIANQTVVWTVTPAGSATLNPTTNTSNTQGLASTVATLSANAVGTITVKGALTGSLSNLSATFTITVNVQVTALQKVSGDSQTAPAGQAFQSPLVVQVNASNGQPAKSFPVNFSISGPGTLSAGSVNTDSNGRAQVNVTATSTSGTVTVTASAAGFTQTFTLTVIPPGPNLSGGSIVNGADFQRNSISPCSIATILATGLAPTVQGVVSGAGLVGPLAYTVATDKVTVNNSQAPIYSVSNVNSQEQLTFQVPCDVTPAASVPLTVNVGGGSATTNIQVLPGSPGIFNTVMSDGASRAVLVRPDGSFVSLQNPARRGEPIRVYVTGLGPTSPSVGTNSTSIPGSDARPTGQVIVGVNNAGAGQVSARLAPGLVGVFEVTFTVPPDAPTGNDVVLSVAVNVPGDTATRFSGGSKMPIQ